MTPVLLALQLGAAPMPVTPALRPPPTLAPYAAPTTSVWRHGPDGPDDVPEDGYEFKASKKSSKKLLWAGMGAMAIAGLTASAARNQSYTMREAQTMSELDAAYLKQQRLAYTTYGLLGAGALCMVLEIPF